METTQYPAILLSQFICLKSEHFTDMLTDSKRLDDGSNQFSLNIAEQYDKPFPKKRTTFSSKWKN